MCNRSLLAMMGCHPWKVGLGVSLSIRGGWWLTKRKQRHERPAKGRLQLDTESTALLVLPLTNKNPASVDAIVPLIFRLLHVHRFSNMSISSNYLIAGECSFYEVTHSGRIRWGKLSVIVRG